MIHCLKSGFRAPWRKERKGTGDYFVQEILVDKHADMRFVKKITPPDFQAYNFTPLFSPNFNSFGDETTKKVSENGEIYTAGKNFTLPPALMTWTNSTFHLCPSF